MDRLEYMTPDMIEREAKRFGSPSDKSPPQEPDPSPNDPLPIVWDEIAGRNGWSDSCKHFFRELTSSLSSGRILSAYKLTPRWFFLQLLIHGGRQEGESRYTTQKLFKACDLSRAQLEQLNDIQTIVHAVQPFCVLVDPDLAKILEAALELGTAIGNNRITAIRHLVAAFVFRATSDGKLMSYLDLRRFGIKTDHLLQAMREHITQVLKQRDDPSPGAEKTWKRAVELLDNALRGQRIQVAREAGDAERCLDVEQYAEVLAILLRQADDKEFNLGVFGHWGRGKTYLMSQTASALAMRRGKADRGFETVTFSAWQYPSRPEVWVHLYETFAKKAFCDVGWKSVSVIIRAGIARRGYGPILFAYVLGVIGLVPFFTKLELIAKTVWYLYATIGLFGVLTAWAFYSAVIQTHQRLKDHYLSATRHAEKLGLQATIGEDLVALLKGWVPIGGIGVWFYVGFAVISLGAAGTIGWRVKHYWQAPVSAVVAAATFLIVAALTCRWLFPWKPEPKKVLLIVDDLDRCDPSHLLSVMESIKLMLEKSEISRRVLVAMLIEEDILKHAIWQKYSHLADKEACLQLNTNFDGQRIARENCEKLFTVHLRLPELQPSEISAVVENFAPAEHRREQPAAPPPSQPTSAPRGSQQSASKIKAASLYIADDGKTDATDQLAYSEIILGEEERNTISKVLGQKCEGRYPVAPLGPRAIRAFIFRYQLARLILAKRQIKDWQTHELIVALAESLFEQRSTSAAETTKPIQLSSEVAAVVKQVT